MEGCTKQLERVERRGGFVSSKGMRQKRRKSGVLEAGEGFRGWIGGFGWLRFAGGRFGKEGCLWGEITEPGGRRDRLESRRWAAHGVDWARVRRSGESTTIETP